MRAAGGERGRIRNTLALGLGCASIIGCLSLGSVLVAPEKKHHQYLEPFLLGKTTSFWSRPSHYLCVRENCSLPLPLLVQCSVSPKVYSFWCHSARGPHTPTLENPSQSCSVHLWHQWQRDTERVDHRWTPLMASVLHAMHNNGSLK